MVRLVAKGKRKQWQAVAVVLFVLLFALAQYVAVAAAPAGAAGETDKIMVNNVWVDVPLTQVFRDISIETNVVIALCPHVPDPLVSLDAGLGKPLEECLGELVVGRGLFIRPRNKKFYLISCGSPACPSFMEIAESKRLYLKYITARHLVSSLPGSVRHYVTSGERPNEVLVYTVPEIMKRIMEMVGKLDVPRQQVVLEVLVVELWEEASEQFGIDWEYSDRHNAFSMTEGLGAFTGIARYTSVPKSELTQLLFTLRALVGEDKAKIRSRPRVATLNGEKATIDISLDEYFTIATDLYGSTSTLRTELEVIKSGVLLDITPHIGDNGDITIDVVTEVSDVASRQNQIAGNTSGDLPIIRRRKADTCVRVKEGDAIVIGGLVETQERSEDKSVPILSSIPLLGGIFKAKDTSAVKKEVIIFITPRLMREARDPLSERHDMIGVEEELEALRVSGRLDMISVEKELETLQKVVASLSVQDGDIHGLRDRNDEKVFLYGRRNPTDVREVIESLEDVVAVLDVEK